jgi:hypothetical protein
MKTCKTCEHYSKARKEAGNILALIGSAFLSYVFFVVGGTLSLFGFIVDGWAGYVMLFGGYGCFVAMMFLIRGMHK